MAIELSIRVSGTEKSYTHKHLIYIQDELPISLCYNDPILTGMKNEAIDEFKKISQGEDPEDVVFRIKMIWR
jgi:hypothetical protein